MNKLIISIFAFAFCISLQAQNLTEYTASNNVTYHIGDTIKLGRGSSPSGDFRYIQLGDLYNFASAMNGQYGEVNRGINKNNSGRNVIVKKIKEVKIKGSKVVYFYIAGGNISQYQILIEDALATGEVKSNGYTSDEALAELKRSKDKLDLGLIKQEQFDSIKVKLSKLIK
jgi:hypothetical protein